MARKRDRKNAIHERHVREGHWDGHGIYLTVTTAFKECRSILILEMSIARPREVKVTFP